MRALLAAALLLALPALGWESYCYQYQDPSQPPADYASLAAPLCAPFAGPNTARHRWVGPLDEHRALFEATREKAGLPAALSETLALRVFTSAAQVQVGPGQATTLIPAARPTRAQTRFVTVGELAQLPDFSYSLWDWALGHETCPLGEVGATAEACHDFASHMGPVNANHFLPLAQGFYARYHQLALERAAQCRALGKTLADAGVAERFAAFPRACEAQALILEAVGHHYLQDAFSTGHMWQRWGSPELTDFSGPDPLERRDRAVLVALVAGMIHGSRGVLQRLPDWTSFDVNDAMCAPHEAIEYVRSDGAVVRGLGDDYLHQLGTLPEHQARLYSCATSGLLQIYAASGAQHGPLGALAEGLASVDPTGPECFGQRVTNRAMLVGAAIQFKLLGQQIELPLDSRHVGWLVPKVARSTGAVPVAQPLRDQFRYQLMRQVSLMRLHARRDPTGTELADGALGPLLDAEPNGAYLRTPVASYDEPALPWPNTPDPSEAAKTRAEALARTFHRAHAADWCAQTPQAELDGLRAHARDVALDADSKAAACEACAETAVRHLRVGADALSYDTGREPLCQFLGGSAYAYQSGSGEPLALARAWCGCP